MQTHQERRSSSGAPLGAPLDLHEEVSTPEGADACERWPENLRLISSGGAFVKGRCGSTNRCSYCAKLSAVLVSERLALDAMESGNSPTVYVVLTTRSTSHDQRDFYDSRRKFWKAVKRRWPDAEYACVLEFTTGRAGRSAGYRRLHWNWLIKGVPDDDATRRVIKRLIKTIWCAREDATMAGQYVGSVQHEGGLMRYLALHFQKEAQAPPQGWRGCRFTYSRHTARGAGAPGYFGEPGWKNIETAREALAWKRELHKAVTDGYSGDEAEIIADFERLKAKRARWELVKLIEREVIDGNGEITREWTGRVSRLDGGEPRAHRRDRTEDRAKRARWHRDETAYLELIAELREQSAGPDTTRPDAPQQVLPVLGIGSTCKL